MKKAIEIIRKVGFTAILLIMCLGIGILIGKYVCCLPPRSAETVTTESIPAERGEIFDCKGNIIAANKTLYDMHIDCCTVTDPEEWEGKSRLLAQELTRILPEKTAPQWWEYLQNGRRKNKRYLPLAKNIDSIMVDTLCKLPLLSQSQFYGGRIITRKAARDYPFGNIARRSIGVLLAFDQGNMFGLEGRYDAELKGRDGSRTVKHVLRRGKPKKREISREDKIDGWDIYSTIDMNLQAIADSALRAAVTEDKDIAGGCCIVMETESGEIKAMANISRSRKGFVGEYFNYSIGYSYEPGEVTQTMTLAAALSDGLVKSLDEKIPTNKGRLCDTIDFTDQYIRAYERSHQTDSISILDGFTISSKYVAGNIALRYSESADYYYQWIRSFSISSPDFDLYGLREPDLVNSQRKDKTTLLAMGSGYEFTTAPFQILTFYNAIANEGRMMKPMLVKEMKSDVYGTKSFSPMQIGDRIIRPEIADSLTKALTLCVENGTGKALKGLPEKIAGKTGTSRQIIASGLRGESEDPYQDDQGRKQYAGTFVGFYPAEAPRYSVMCVYCSPNRRTRLFTEAESQRRLSGRLLKKSNRCFRRKERFVFIL